MISKYQLVGKLWTEKRPVVQVVFFMALEQLRFFGGFCSGGALDASCCLFLLERWKFSAELLADLAQRL